MLLAYEAERHFPLTRWLPDSLQAGELFPLPAEIGSSKVQDDWIYAFSALRDPRRKEIRFLFDALEAKAKGIEKVVFLKQGPNSMLQGSYEVLGWQLELISDPAGRDMQRLMEYRKEGDPLEFQEGWELTCQDHYQDSQRALLIYNGTRYASFQIETIEIDRIGKVAACVGPLYTERRLTKLWIDYSSKLGIERFHIYHAIPKDVSGVNPWSIGIWPSFELGRHSPVNLFHHDRIRWYTYEAPPLRYYQGQTTALNDCLVRNRYLFEYLAILDVDEIVRIDAGSRMDLGSLLDRHFPITASSMSIPRYNFPLRCCTHPFENKTWDQPELSIPFFESCRKHVMKDHDVGKSVLRPELVESASQHLPIRYRIDYESRISIDPKIAHIVHVSGHSGWGVPTDCKAAHEGFQSDWICILYSLGYI